MLWIRSKETNETVIDRLGVKVRAIPRDTFNQEFDKQPVSNDQGAEWLAQNHLSWNDGFPKQTFCDHQELYPIVLQTVITAFDEETDEPIYDNTLNLNDPVVER